MAIKKQVFAKTVKTAESVEGLTPEKVYQDFATLQADVQNKISALGSAVTSKIEKLKELADAIESQKDKLAELYNIEKEAQELEEYKLKVQDSIETFKREIAKQRLEWDDAKTSRDKEWQRQEEQHAYDMDTKIKRAETELNEMIAEKKRAEKAREQILDKTWADRENELKRKEEEFNSLKVQVANFDEILKAKVEEAELATTAKIKRDYDHQIDLLKRDADSDKRLLAAKIEACTETIDSLKNNVASLQSDLEKERKTTESVTREALQSASGRAAMQAVQETLTNSSDSKNKK